MSNNQSLMNTVISDEDRKSVSINDDTDPRSIINMVAPSLREKIEAMEERWFEMDESDLKMHVQPTITVQRLRLSFWAEYDNAVMAGKPMAVSRIVAGLVTKNNWNKTIVTDQRKLAWILSPPHDYVMAMKEALNAGMESIRRIMAAPVLNKDGSLNTKTAEVVLKAFALIDMRVKGAIIQRVQQETVNVNLNKTTHTHTVEALPSNIEEIDKQLEDLRNKIKPVEIPQVSLEKAIGFTETVRGKDISGRAKVINKGGSAKSSVYKIEK